MRTKTSPSLRSVTRASIGLCLLAAIASVGAPAARAEGAAAGPRAPIPTSAVALVVRQDTPLGAVVVARPATGAGAYSALRVGPISVDPPTRNYRITGPVAGVGGVVLASAYDRGSCSIASWGPGAIDLLYSPDPADRHGLMACAVVYTKVNERAAVTAPLAYGFFGVPTVATQVAPMSFGFNSASPVAADAPRATRTGPGRYRVEIARMAAGDTSGNVQVTPYGAGGRACRVGPLSRTGEDTLAFDVRCDDLLTPRPADTAFSFLFTRGSNPWGSRLAYASGLGGPDGLSGAAGAPSLPTLAADTLTVPGAGADSVVLLTSTKDDAVCRPSFGPPSAIPVRCDGGRRAGYSFLVLR